MKKFLKLARKKVPGLSIIEMIISLSIITFITAIFVNNYRSANKRTDLIMTSQSVVADIHRAQNNALGLTRYGDVFPAGGWGINFDLAHKNKYVVFADLNAPGDYDGGFMKFNPETEGDVSKGARVVEFPPETELHAIRWDGLDVTTNANASITFLPPDPRTSIHIHPYGTTTAVEIDIRELRNNSIKTIKVNFLGLAEVVDRATSDGSLE